MMEQTKLERIISGVVLLALLVGCLLVLRPFVSALLWAAVLCFSTWPFYKRLLSLVRGRRMLAAMLMTLGMILIILLPFVIVGGTRADNVKEFISAARPYVDAGPPPPPAWLAKIPAVGQQATERWQALATDNAQLLEAAKRFIQLVGARQERLTLRNARKVMNDPNETHSDRESLSSLLYRLFPSQRSFPSQASIRGG